MKISEIIKTTAKPYPSLEIVPPLRGITKDELLESIAPFMEFSPKYINVTSHRDEYEFIQLEDGSYTAEREINAEYQITARVRVGNAEFVVGEHPKAPDRFVTWERNCQNDGDGPPNYFWGHYGSNRAAIIEDFCERASGEHWLQHPVHEHKAGKER